MKTRMAFLLTVLMLAGCGGGGGGGGGDNGGDDTSTVLRVGLGQDYGSIQAALDVAESGDVIEVHPETYEENNITINKEITLRSTYPDDPAIVAQTIIKASGNNNDGISIYPSAGKAKVQGLTVKGSDRANSGITSESSLAIIEKNIVTGFTYGIRVIAEGANIKDNEIFGNMRGIDFWISQDLEANISGNYIHDNQQFGINLQGGAKRVTLIDNKIKGNGVAVYYKVLDGSVLTIHENTIENNKAGISLNGGSTQTPDWIEKVDIEIEKNTITNNKGIGIADGSGIRIDVKGDGSSNERKIKINDNRITGNQRAFDYNGAGIYVGPQNSHVYLTNNVIIENKTFSNTLPCAGAGVFVDTTGPNNISYLVDATGAPYNINIPNWGGNTIILNTNHGNPDNICPTSY